MANEAQAENVLFTSLDNRIAAALGRSTAKNPKESAKVVENFNRMGIGALMQGASDGALSLFLQALEYSGFDTDLQAQCLINIADWRRRVRGELQVALETFETLEKNRISPATRARLMIMKAMVYTYPTEHGQNDPDGIRKSIDLIKQSLKYIRLIANENEGLALETKCFATHRLTGTVCEYGTEQDKQEALELIEELVSDKRIQEDERARFFYAKAVIQLAKDPWASYALLMTSAQMVRDTSTLDCCDYYAKAGLVAFSQHAPKKAQECLDLAETLAAEANRRSITPHHFQYLAELREKLAPVSED